MIRRRPDASRIPLGIRLAGIVLVTVPVFACSASTDLQRIDTQLGEIQTQIQQLRASTATAGGVAAVDERLDRGLRASVNAGAETRQAVEHLTARVEQLGSQLEDAGYRLGQLADQIALLRQELDALRLQVEAERSAPTPAVEPPDPDPADPQALYDRAYADFQGGRYELAIDGFRRYVERFPATDLTDNAVYWIGESYYRQQQFDRAAAQFDEVITRFPDSDRVPSALLKKGYADLELGQRERGVELLQQVIRAYPGSDEAQLARQRLDGLGIDGDG